MAGFFSVRIAPGLRVSASSRGLRSHIGPRGARLHVGGGGTGVSTGTGPFTYYHPLSGGRRQGSSRSPSAAAGRRRASKAERAAELAAAILRIDGLHRQQFPPARAPVAPVPDTPSRDEVLAELQRQHRGAARWWQWSRRRDASRRARAELPQRWAKIEAATRHTHQLLQGDPDTVLAALAESFEDNDAPVAPVGVEGDEAHLVVLVPGLDAVPSHHPTTTQAGNLSIRRMSKTDRWALYRQLVAGHALVSAREAFAVAPSLEHVSLVVLRDEEDDVYGEPRAAPVLATRLTRATLHGIRWPEVTAWDVIEQVSQDTLLNTWGRAREVRGLDLADEPDLVRLIDAVDLDALDHEIS
ncbi:DUF4236 domain-containing protein [Ornithinimicrobium faecis]|uniref:DUF4236 domain-containing protein n=1 Tax=Ornithinimicrobium faecis TaxID=2934158 RepID=A0ABY4YR94_9MICO|nr:DUF4236 domain-containing protein [Ornithinimicrobium sp. HY1793]USQ79223.1 DUF4236 domain-containing protein [Ornithinimicrobium sp. HY1793]